MGMRNVGLVKLGICGPRICGFGRLEPGICGFGRLELGICGFGLVELGICNVGLVELGICNVGLDELGKCEFGPLGMRISRFAYFCKKQCNQDRGQNNQHNQHYQDNSASYFGRLPKFRWFLEHLEPIERSVRRHINKLRRIVFEILQ